jgi:hypothetical protein
VREINAFIGKKQKKKLALLILTIGGLTLYYIWDIYHVYCCFFRVSVSRVLQYTFNSELFSCTSCAEESLLTGKYIYSF